MTARTMPRAKILQPARTPMQGVIHLLEEASDRIERMYFDDVDAREQRSLVDARTDVQEALLRLRCLERRRT